MYVCKNNKTIILLASSGVPSLNRGMSQCWGESTWQVCFGNICLGHV